MVATPALAPSSKQTSSTLLVGAGAGLCEAHVPGSCVRAACERGQWKTQQGHRAVGGGKELNSFDPSPSLSELLREQQSASISTFSSHLQNESFLDSEDIQAAAVFAGL